MSQSAERQLVLCCARTRAGVPIRERIRSLAATEIDWHHVFELVVRHGVIALVSRMLDAVVPDAVPSPIRERMYERCLANAMHSAFLGDQLAGLVGLMDAEGLRALYFKGPILAQSVYGHVS